jgi:hypothetical protein
MGDAAGAAAASVADAASHAGLLGVALQGAGGAARELDGALFDLGVTSLAAGDKVESAGVTIASVMEQQTEAVIKLRDEMEKINAQQPIIDQQRQTAHEAEMQRLYEEGQALAHAGDITDIVNAEQVAARNFAAQQAEQAAREQAAAEAKAAREMQAAQDKAARDATAANRAAARAAEQAWRESHQATATGAVRTAAVQIAAAQAVVDSTNAMQQQMTASYGNASGGLLMDTGSQAGRRVIYGMTLVQPTVVNIDQRGATVGVDNLQRTITDTVNNGLRNGSVRISGTSAR